LSDRPLIRRLVTIPVVLALFVVITLGLPVVLVSALLVDLYRRVTSRARWVSLRMVLFLWCYLLGQVWALAALLAVTVVGRDRSLEATFRLQQAWAAWNFAAVRRLFRLDLEVTGSEVTTPGPIVILSRHASMIDTLLPPVLISSRFGTRLRYVLKKELLVDPALDIAGNRLPNFFVDRGSGESERERGRIRALATGLRADEGMLIYPEGTRYSEEKRQRYAARLTGKEGRVGEVARSLRNVLPPRPGGTLAILEATDADVVVLAHTGLEGFATARDIWQGDLVGSRIIVSFRRIPRADIPVDRSARVDWLFEVWADIDDWVETARSTPGR
jgi:1-acyl-sn-glycerol-3-phosphate acyltransferase